MSSYITALSSKLGGGPDKNKPTKKWVHKSEVLIMDDCPCEEIWKPIPNKGVHRKSTLDKAPVCLITVFQQTLILDKMANEEGEIEIGQYGKGELSELMPKGYVPEEFYAPKIKNGPQFACYSPTTKLRCMKVDYIPGTRVAALHITADNKPESYSEFSVVVNPEHVIGAIHYGGTLFHATGIQEPISSTEKAKAIQFVQYIMPIFRLKHVQVPPKAVSDAGGIGPAYLAIFASNNGSPTFAQKLELAKETRRGDKQKQKTYTAKSIFKMTSTAEKATKVLDKLQDDSSPGTFVRAATRMP